LSLQVSVPRANWIFVLFSYLYLVFSLYFRYNILMERSSAQATQADARAINDLVHVWEKIECGVSPDEAVAASPMMAGDSEPFIPPGFLEGSPRRRRLGRGHAAAILDLYARAAADLFSSGARLACFYAARLEAHAGYRRLGYRNASAYATEELGITGRAFRDMARLGKRLESLPRTKKAFLGRKITWTEAEVIAGIATACDEEHWLAAARTSTVRELKAMARVAREKLDRAEGSPAANSAEMDASDMETAERKTASEIAEIDEPDPRHRYTLSMPEWMVGKLDAVLELTAVVAGANMPLGARFELIAAEFLSGAEALVEDPGNDHRSEEGQSERTVGFPRPHSERLASALASSQASGPPEDPRGYRQFLENESQCWSFLPGARSPILMRGPWSSLADDCLALSKEPDVTPTPIDDRQNMLGPGENRERALWALHHKLKRELRRERGVAWQLGRVLGMIRNRRLWKVLRFCSFSHYVSERLGISSRVAQRLIRVDRQCWEHPYLADCYQRGELSLLRAEALLRGTWTWMQHEHSERAWVEYAKQVTHQRLADAIRWAERQCLGPTRGWVKSPLLPPTQSDNIAPSLGGAARSSGSPMFVNQEQAASRTNHESISVMLGLSATTTCSRPETATCGRPVWLSDDEKEVLARAVDIVRVIRGPDWPLWACINDLLDHFLQVYDSEEFKALRRKHPLMERDGWRCKVPGCDAHEALHLHHIVFRSHGGGDEPANLVTLCDFHHLSLHRGWIRCRGTAPHHLYWELGVPSERNDPSRRPIALIFGHRRLLDHERWEDERRLDHEPWEDAGPGGIVATAEQPADQRVA
jgi:hypothetical protein